MGPERLVVAWTELLSESVFVALHYFYPLHLRLCVKVLKPQIRVKVSFGTMMYYPRQNNYTAFEIADTLL